MIEINVYWLYWTAMATLPLKQVEPGTPLSFVAGNLVTARFALETLSGGRAFPKTVEQINELTGVINAILPSRVSWQLVQDRALTALEISQLRHGIDAVTVTLEQESRHSYVLCIEDQRCLSAHTLVEKIESCFPKKAWNKITREAKAEFEESGKCLAMERYTGAGFHALRGVECVVRQWILLVVGTLPKNRNLGGYLEVLRQNGADANLIAILDNIRTLDRNPLMHPEDSLDIDDAVGIFNVSQTTIARIIADLETKGKI